MKYSMPDPVSSAFLGLASNAGWDAVKLALKAALGARIRITAPRPLESASNGKPLGNGVQFPVHGTLRSLPIGCEIWLLTQDEATGRVWPQGFAAVQYDPRQKTWQGWVNGSGMKRARIIATVAPPTSQDYFRFFQQAGVARGFKFDPLPKLPAECVNYDAVQVLFPEA